jgi:hypothetical protein
MYIGTSIFLIAVGAILKFAVTATVAGIDIQTAGVILMVVGAVALMISLMEQLIWADRRRTRAVEVEREVVTPREYR